MANRKNSVNKSVSVSLQDTIAAAVHKELRARFTDKWYVQELVDEAFDGMMKNKEFAKHITDMVRAELDTLTSDPKIIRKALTNRIVNG